MVAPALDWTDRGIASGKYHPVSGIPTQLGVLHSAECPIRIGVAQSLTEWAAVPLAQGGPEAGWQRFVDPGVRLRFIPDYLGAWAASEANVLSISWEQGGYARFTRDEWTTPLGLVQLDNLAYDMAEVARRDGLDPRWLSTAEVRAVLDHGNRTIKGFCTHRQIDPETRTDPGDGYPYDLLMTRIRHYLGTPAEPVKENTDMPTVRRERVPLTPPRRLAEARAWTAAAAPSGNPFTNFASGGPGVYDVSFFWQGQELPVGETVQAQLFIEGKGGKLSGHYPVDASGTEEGTFRGNASWGAVTVAAGERLLVKFTSSKESAYLTGFGADIKVWSN